ncbi:hypothetical protein DYST_00538 [Dyella terrae]|nr:hypothetical protein DYST_00538 [Dyella terrae]
MKDHLGIYELACTWSKMHYRINNGLIKTLYRTIHVALLNTKQNRTRIVLQIVKPSPMTEISGVHPPNSERESFTIGPEMGQITNSYRFGHA